MGRPKSLLPYRSSTFSRSILTSLEKGGLKRRYVVIGSDPGPIVAHLCDLDVTFVYNADWPKGQMSSLQSAIRGFPPVIAAMLVTLVDQPGLLPSTIRHIVGTWRRFPDRIVSASYRGRGGHPVIFPRLYFKELLAAPVSEGARAVLARHPARRLRVELADPAVTRDVDTLKDYKTLVD